MNLTATATTTKKTTKKNPVKITGFVIDCCDHDFLARFKPTRKAKTYELGWFKGYKDARYVERPTLGSEVGRFLYESMGPQSSKAMAFGFLAPWNVRLVATTASYPATLQDDGWTEVTIRSVSVETFEAMREEATKAAHCA